jgi:hypothetical protein
MSEVWLAIVTDIDDGNPLVNGVFDNEVSAKECVDDDSLSSRALVYKVELDKVKSIYIPFEEL